MKISTSVKPSKDKKCLVVFCLAEKKSKPVLLTSFPEIEEVFYSALNSTEMKENDSFVFYGVSDYHKTVVFAIGRSDPVFRGESLRRSAAPLFKLIKDVPSVDIDLLNINEISAAVSLDSEKTIKSLAEGLFLSSYRFNKYMTAKKDGEQALKRVNILCESEFSIFVKSVAAVCDSVFTARDLVNEPGNILDPAEFSKRAQELARKYNFKYSVIKKDELEKLGMGGILGVNKGSSVPARMVVLEYKGKSAEKHLLLVGKGITFDSGGISLKPSEKMEDMKCDMAGGAAVLSAISAAARLGININVTGLIPLTDNKPDASAQNPGDILKMHNGTTVEIISTDAEGRLILADAISYGISKFKPDLTIDLATLTGACVTALGKWACGLMTNDDSVVSVLEDAGKESFERVWQLPLFDDYTEQIKSDYADIKNTGGRQAGPITAGKFLEKFTDSKPWVHLDIAGTAYFDAESSYISKGGTGFGVRLLIEFMEIWGKNR